jgi:hypothetical protein
MDVKETIDDDEKNIAELAGEYVETYLKLAVVNINLKTAEISAVASFSMIAGLLVFFICMFLGLAAGQPAQQQCRGIPDRKRFLSAHTAGIFPQQETLVLSLC